MPTAVPPIVACPSCGSPNPPGARACTACGRPLSFTMEGEVLPAEPGAGAIPPLPADASPEEKEAHWRRYIYRGDRMPQLTFRAVAMGAVLGMLMSISHLYTSLKIGWGFGIAIAACVISYVSWNALRALGAGALSRMTILENNCMQSTASAAGYSTGSTVATAVGATLLITGEHFDWWRLGLFVFFAAGLGVFIAIPMKRQIINIEQLPFPSGIAAAETLTSLYSHGVLAMRKAYALLIAMALGAMIGVLRAPERALAWLDRGFEWMKEHGVGVRLPDLLFLPQPAAAKAVGARVQGLGFEPSGLLIAAGMIVGPRVAFTMLAGGLALYFWIGPQMMEMDQSQLAALAAAGKDAAGYVRNVPSNAAGTMFRIHQWSLWGGTSIMVVSSLASLALQWRTLARSFRVFKRGPAARPAGSPVDDIEVPLSWLVAGLIPFGIGMVIVQYIAFNISPGLGIVAVLLSGVIALVCCRATGETDTTPTGAMGKVTQAVYAVLAPGNAMTNLMAAGATSSSGLAAADLLTDLKSGYILGANPRKQFLAQFIGVFFGTIAVIPGWYLMVPDKAALEAFNPPATNMWRAVAEALTKGLDYIPVTARWAIVVGAIIGAVLPVLEKLFPKAKPYLPSAMGLGLSWVMTFANSFSFAIGAAIAWIWTRAAKKNAESYNVPIASGLIAGESLMAAIIAILATVANMTR